MLLFLLCLEPFTCTCVAVCYNPYSALRSSVTFDAMGRLPRAKHIYIAACVIVGLFVSIFLIGDHRQLAVVMKKLDTMAEQNKQDAFFMMEKLGRMERSIEKVRTGSRPTTSKDAAQRHSSMRVVKKMYYVNGPGNTPRQELMEKQLTHSGTPFYSLARSAQ